MRVIWYPIQADTDRGFDHEPRLSYRSIRPLSASVVSATTWSPEGGFFMKTCSIDGCERKHYAKSWCEMHHVRWRRSGDPETVRIVRHTGTASERFWQKVQKTETCWIWMASRQQFGYGQFCPTRSKKVRAHRFAYEDVRGPIPEGMVLDHLCRNPPCVNPSHLEPVTTRENLLRGVAPTIKVHLSKVCKRGHSITDGNTVGIKHPRCGECARAGQRERSRRSK